MFKISIIIPVYNSERFLSSSLDSIVNQSMPLEDIQVILVNDGSSDNSQKIIDEYVEKYNDSFICIKHESPSGGAGKPRNTGMKHVKSEYVMFMDSDDRLDEKYCEILYNQIESEKSNIVCCSYVTFFDEDFSFENSSKIIRRYLKPLENKFNYSNIPFTVWGKIIRFDFIKEKGITFVHQDWEDLLFSALVFYYNDEITFLSNYCGYLYNKVDWGNTYSSSKESKSVDGLLRRISTMNILIDFSIKINDSIFNNYIQSLMKWHFLNLFENPLNKTDNIKYVNELRDVKLSPNINFSLIYSFVNYLVKNKKYNLINLLRRFKFYKILYFSNMIYDRY